MGSNHSNSQHMVSFSRVNPTDKNNKAREAPSERESTDLEREKAGF